MHHARASREGQRDKSTLNNSGSTSKFKILHTTRVLIVRWGIFSCSHRWVVCPVDRRTSISVCRIISTNRTSQTASRPYPSTSALLV